VDSTGSFGEKEAEKYLTKIGYSILYRNFRSRFGEIDIIAKNGGQVVFVEVKTRTQEMFGTPLEAITPQKIRKIIKTAQYYILRNNISDYRFDDIEVQLGAREILINHIKNITF